MSNHALSATITQLVGTNFGGSYLPTFMGDGTFSAMFDAIPVNGQTVEVLFDLGSNKDIRQFAAWRGVYGQDFTFQVQCKDSNGVFQTVTSLSLNGGDYAKADAVFKTPINTRYVKILIPYDNTNKRTIRQFQINEFVNLTNNIIPTVLKNNGVTVTDYAGTKAWISDDKVIDIWYNGSSAIDLPWNVDFDLGSNKIVSEFMLHSETSYPIVFSLYYYNGSWNLIQSGLTNNTAIKYVNFSDVIASKLRIQITAINNYYLSIKEAQFRGKGFAVNSLTPNQNLLINSDAEFISTFNNALWYSSNVDATFSAGSTSYKKKVRFSSIGSKTIFAHGSFYTSVPSIFTLNGDGSVQLNTTNTGYQAITCVGALASAGDYVDIVWRDDAAAAAYGKTIFLDSPFRWILYRNSLYDDAAVTTTFSPLATGDVIRYKRNFANKLELYISRDAGITWTLIKTSSSNISSTQLMYLPFPDCPVGTKYNPPQFSNDVNFETITTIVANAPTADFTFPLTINHGANLSITGTSTYTGTPSFVWEIDDVVTIPSSGTGANPTFNGLADGLRKVKLTITDDVGSNSKPVYVLVKNLQTAAANIQTNIATEFISTIPNADWSIAAGGGSIAAGGNSYKKNLTFTTTGLKTVRAANPSNSSQYEEITVTVYAPLVANFTAPDSINLGDVLTLNDASAGGYGTRVQNVWKIDGFVVTPANNDYINPTFTGLAAGDHTIKLAVTDSSGTNETAPINLFVGTVTGAGFVVNGQAADYSSNVPTTRTWEILFGGAGSINSSGQFVAPDSGSGQSLISAYNGTRRASKYVNYGAGVSADFSANGYYLANANFTLNGIAAGSATPFTYQWINTATNAVLGTSVNQTLNLPVGVYSIKFKVTDNYGNIAEQTRTFNVVTTLPFNFITDTLNFATKNSSYNQTIQFSGGSGTPTFVKYLGNYPAGISLNFSGGVLSLTGPPTTAGLYVFGIKGTDGAGKVIKRIFTLLVKDAAISAFTLYITANTYRAGSNNPSPLFVHGDPTEIFLQSVNNSGGVTYSDNGAGGAFVAVNSLVTKYVPLNRNRLITITASDNATSASKTLTVTATIPLNATWGGEGSLDRDTKVQKAKGGVKYFREEDKTTQSAQLDFAKRDNDEYEELFAFWAEHRKIKLIYFLDMDTGDLYLCRFTSELKWRKDGGDSRSLFVNIEGYYTGVKFDVSLYDIGGVQNNI